MFFHALIKILSNLFSCLFLAPRPTQVMPVNTATFTRRKPTIRSKLPGLAHLHHNQSPSSQSEPATPNQADVDWSGDTWKNNHAFVPYRERSADRIIRVDENSPRSDASLRTDVLLQDTNHVMQALENMVHSRQKSDPAKRGGAVIAPKPIKPRGQSRDQGQKLTAKQDMTVKEKVLFHLSGPGSRYSDVKRSSLPHVIHPTQVNTNYRDPDDVSESGSFVSGRSDISETQSFTRGVGKSKSFSTRTNRTFALRRARADAEASGKTRTQSPGARSDISQGSQSSKTGARSTATSSTVRKGYQTQSEASSLGMKIVKRSRDHQDLSRNDGGRFSMRAGRSSSVEAQNATVSQLKKPSLGSIQSSRSTTSLTSSNSARRTISRDSQKQAEKTAWLKRKEYDPRASVAKAKSTKPRRTRNDDDDDPPSTCSTPDRRPRLRKDTYTSSAEDLSVISIESGAYESADEADVSFRSDTIANASRELAKDLKTLAVDGGAGKAELHTAVSDCSMYFCIWFSKKRFFSICQIDVQP